MKKKPSDILGGKQAP